MVLISGVNIVVWNVIADLRNFSEEQNRELPLGEERGNAFESSSRFCRWACEWPSWLGSPSGPRKNLTSASRHNPIYLASPTPRDAENYQNNTSDTVSTDSTSSTSSQLKTNSQLALCAHLPSNSSFPKSLISLLDVSQSNQNTASSSDEEDGGDDQDEESDSSTECSSSDNEENSSPLVNEAGAAAAFQAKAREPLHAVNCNSGNGVCQVKHATKGSSTLKQGEWPKDRPLPLPAWDKNKPSRVVFKNLQEYESFAGYIELISQQTVAGHKYNTVENYIR